MLVRLYGENFRSLRDPFEFSMVAANLNSEADRDRGVIDVQLDGTDEKLTLLRSAAIYGKNASGKSSVLQAALGLQWLIQYSSSETEPGKKLRPYEPFVLDTATQTKPVLLGCIVVHEKSLLQYEIEFTAKSIVKEVLKSLGSQECLLIDRHGDNPIEGDLITRSKANQLYVKGMQPNVSVLSKLAQHGPATGDESARPFYQAILSATEWDDYSGHTMSFPWSRAIANERFSQNEEFRTWTMNNLITTSDVGICGVETREVEVQIPEVIRKRMKEKGDLLLEKDTEIEFIHSGSSDTGIDFREESAGTRKIYNLSHDWWRLAHEDVTIFADELGASLHPRLLDALIHAINDRPRDGIKSQLIFAPHDTGLLEGRDGLPAALRRDQVYFTEKNEDGVSTLYSLCEFGDEARGVHNIRKRYLSGRYGAIPMVEGISL